MSNSVQRLISISKTHYYGLFLELVNNSRQEDKGDHYRERGLDT